MTRRRFVLVAVLLAGAALIAVGVRAVGGSAHATAAPLSVEFSAPASIPAGSTAAVAVTVTAAETVEIIEVLAVAGRETHRFEVPVVAGQARFEAGPPLTDEAGLVSLLATTASGPAHTTFTVTPGAAAAIDPLAGPRTIVADGDDETMIVTVPVDGFGNPLADGAPVTIGVTRPDGTTTDLIATTDNGIAAVRFRSSTQAGPVTIAAASGGARGPAVRIDQVAGSPAPFRVQRPEADATRPLVADGRTLHTLTTTALVDSTGNPLPDGVSVDVTIDSPRGPGRVTTVVVAGRAEIVVESPPTPGVVTVEATIDGITGAPSVLDFAPAVATFPVTAERIDDAVVVVVGPVLDRQGAFVPDGTRAAIGATTAIIQDGMATVQLPESEAGPLHISVLGADTTVMVPS